MKFSLIFALAFCLAACFVTQSLALPAPKDNSVADGLDTLKHTKPVLQGRLTCDLLSGIGLNHSACAAHCLLRGNRGGYCNSKAVCVCRN